MQLVVVAALVTVCLSLVLADPPKPTIPTVFTASVEVSGLGNGTIYYSLPTKQMATTTFLSFGDVLVVPGFEGFNTTTYFLANDSFLISNGACRPLGSQFWDMFDWLYASVTKYEGPIVFGGLLCDIWRLTTTSEVLTLYTHGNNPVLLNISSNFADYSGDASVYIFGNDLVPTVDPVFFEPEEQCFLPEQPRCNASVTEPIMSLEAYIFHPADQYNISNQDVADVLGDAMFICLDYLSGHTAYDDYSVVSKYSLLLDSNFGQYALCNNYPGFCVGFEKYAVGREAAYSLGQVNNGQCTNNTLTGSWYSLPAAGECAHGDIVGEDCTWQIRSLVKTINGTCLFETQHLLSACHGDLPWTEASEILKQAFESDDESQGGCPAVTPP